MRTFSGLGLWFNYTSLRCHFFFPLSNTVAINTSKGHTYNCVSAALSPLILNASEDAVTLTLHQTGATKICVHPAAVLYYHKVHG